MTQQAFTPLTVEYVENALRSGCGIAYDWVDYSEEILARLASAAAKGRAKLTFMVPGGARITSDKLGLLGRIGQGYVSMDFSQGY